MCKNIRKHTHTRCAEWHCLLWMRCRIRWVMGRQCEQNAQRETEVRQCSVLSFCSRRAESLHIHTHTQIHTNTLLRQALQEFPLQISGVANSPFFSALSPAVLSDFLPYIDVAQALVASPPHFVFALDWDKRSRGHTLLFLLSCLSLERENSPLFLLLYCNYNFKAHYL